MRIRVRFSKSGKIRFLGHRDVARAWERALRRGNLPVASTEGFSPRPKVHFGLALPMGCESLGEYLDVDLVGDDALSSSDLVALPARLSPLLPEGIDMEAAVEVDPREPSLQQAVTSCAWVIDLDEIEPAQLQVAIEQLLDADRVEIARERKGRQVVDDIRPGVLHLQATGLKINAELATQPRGVRPSELMAALAPQAVVARACRTHQWINTDDAKREPLTAMSGAHAKACAS